MINILIADNNINYAINLMRHVNSTYSNIRVSYISLDGEETLEILRKSNNFDIILLDSKIPYCSCVEIIEQLSINYPNIYDNSFIIMSNEQSLISQLQD